MAEHRFIIIWRKNFNWISCKYPLKIWLVISWITLSFIKTFSYLINFRSLHSKTFFVVCLGIIELFTQIWNFFEFIFIFGRYHQKQRSVLGKVWGIFAAPVSVLLNITLQWLSSQLRKYFYMSPSTRKLFLLMTVFFRCA